MAKGSQNRSEKQYIPSKAENHVRSSGHFSCEKKYQSWESMYLKAVDYYARTGNMNVPVGYCTEDGVLLGAWVDRQRRYYVTLQKEQKEKLKKLGIQ